MNIPLLHSAKTAIATLCVVLSVVFAGASAVSVVDQLQHLDQPAHHHQHQAFSDFSFDDHHQDGDHGAEASDAAGAPERPVNSGHHHHADGPTGLLAAGGTLEVLTAMTGAHLAARSDDLIVSPGSPGPERPPKHLATSV